MNHTDTMKLAIEALAVKFSEGWHEGIKIDASDIMLLNDAAQALAEQPAQQKHDWLTGKQRIYLAQAWAMLDDYALDQRLKGNDSFAEGAEASSHEIKTMLASPPAQQQEARIAQLEAELMRMQGRELKLQFALAEQPAQQQEPKEAMALAMSWIHANGDHDQLCDILDLDDDGKHKPCSCGLSRVQASLREALAEQPAPVQPKEARACEVFSQGQWVLYSLSMAEQAKQRGWIVRYLVAEQPAQQEPVAWEQFYHEMGKPKLAYLSPSESPENACYIPPAQRTWVGLTPEEKKNIFLKWYGKHWAYTKQVQAVMDSVEAKLKERNQ